MPVSKGQHIAYVGQLREEKSKGNFVNHFETMLHFELFKGDGGTNFHKLSEKENKKYLYTSATNY